MQKSNQTDFKIMIDSKSGLSYLAKWISMDLDRWEIEKSVRHHSSAYGGMGSLNDLIICTENKHSVTKT